MVKNHLREIRHELMIDKQIDMARLLGLRQEQYNIYELQRSQPSLELASLVDWFMVMSMCIDI